MRFWYAKPDAPLERSPVKRFAPKHWTVNFPRGTIACLRLGEASHQLLVDAEFLREGDLVGLIWESEDEWSHPAHARVTARDYSGTKLRFRWRSEGLIALDQINGPTLTIEGRDADGNPRGWYVRLWNYASGSPDDATVSLDFDAMASGWEADDPVDPRDIDRMFISLVPPDYVQGSDVVRSAPAIGSVAVTEIECTGPGSVILEGSSWQPKHPFNACTAYDDLYNLPPERVAEAVDRLGHGPIVNHYVGMSHYMALGGDGRIDTARRMNGPARVWHEALVKALHAQGRQFIWSLSFELLDEFCPEPWKQRRSNGEPGLTGWVPPSALVSPANDAAIEYLGTILDECLEIGSAAGLAPKIQIGEPWWWIEPEDKHICLYDDAARAAFGGDPPVIERVDGDLSQEEKDLLDEAGVLLSAATRALVDRAKAKEPSTVSHLLAYLPSILAPEAPEAKRANLPIGWASPAFDVLQLEDYDWVTDDVGTGLRKAALAEVDARLGYPTDEQHYLAGFAINETTARANWPLIIDAANAAVTRGVADVFIWALPQMIREGIVIFGEEEAVEAVKDVEFPIAVGAEAGVRPTFSTQVVVSASGHEQRNADWQQARLEYDAGPGVRSDAEMRALIDFFRARRGRAEGFRFRDPFDHSSAPDGGDPRPEDQEIAIANGVQTRFALLKRYGDGETRRITRPVVGSVRVAVDGDEQAAGWTLGEGGMVEFAVAPGEGSVVSAGFLFDVPVRFAEDRLDINRASFLAGEAPSVPLIEVREGAA
ncbi:DUF2460 domain-containing protein [Sphingomicrobium sp. XHP0239]|uniref:DUF2460 domain-containing protein n=1 Tax=Sphingomicrobium maritimum TaxID=3133972 RepID=UPI0031CC72A7